MRGLGWVVRKELSVFLADRQGALLQIIMPVLLAGLVGMLFAGGGDERTMTLLVADQDATAPTAAFIARLAAADGLTLEAVDAAEAHRRVAQGDAPVALVLPKGTGEALTLMGALTGRHVEATLLQDPSHAFEGGFATGRIQEALFRSLADTFTDSQSLRPALGGLRTLLSAQGQEPDMLRFLDASLAFVDAQPKAIDALGGGGLSLPLTVVTQEVAGEGGPADYNSYAHTFAGMLAMFLMFTGLAAAKGLVEERDNGVLVRLRASPLPRPAILLGVAGAAAVISLVISVAVYAAGILVFHVEVRGSWLGFVAVLLGQSLFIGGFALLLAGVGRTARQIDGLGTFAVLVMSFTGGAWLPSFLMPDWLGTLALGLPTRWATDGLAAMTWRGLDVTVGLTTGGVLLGFAVALGLIGIKTFRWE